MSSAEPIKALVSELHYADEFTEKNQKQRVKPPKRIKLWYIGIHWGEAQLRCFLGYQKNKKELDFYNFKQCPF